MAKMPWDHPQEAPEGTGFPNLPTPEGREMGSYLARWAREAAESQPDLPPMCAGCAFREGTHTNGCAPTLMSALKCLMEGEPFWCHGERSSVPCGGYVALLRNKEES